MDKILEFIKTRKVWYWLTLAATVLMLVELIIYLMTGITHLDNIYSPRAIAGMIIGLALGVVSLVVASVPAIEFVGKYVRAALFAQYVFGLFAFINYFTSQLNLIGSLVYGLDGETLPASLAIGLIIGLIAWVVALVAAIMKKPIKAEKADAANEEA